jgi:hypothetical protein
MGKITFRILFLYCILAVMEYAAGLSPEKGLLKNSFVDMQAKITRTWIVYNKPDDPNFSHAGLLMALGLHKHLGVLAATDVYRYLAQV